MELCLVVDHSCNLRCRYCYTGSKHGGAMSPQIMQQAVRQALAHGDDWLSVSLFGGEPLLRSTTLSQVEEAVESVLGECEQRPALRYVIDTNATLLNTEALDWLEEHDNATVIVSLDGRQSTHDANRIDTLGHGSFERVMQGIAALRERKIALQLVAVISPNRAVELGEELTFLLQQGASRVALQPNLRARWSGEDVEAFRAGAQAAARVWADSFRAGDSFVVEPFHSKVLSHLTRSRPLPGRCQPGTREFTVAPSGRIYSCAEMVGEDRLGERAIGSVRTGLQLEKISALRQRASQEHEACRECELRMRCARGCACKQLASTGAVGGISAALCETEGAWIEAADEQATLLVEERAASFINLYYGGSLPGEPSRRQLPLLA